MKQITMLLMSISLAMSVGAQSIDRHLIGVGGDAFADSEIHLQWSVGESFILTSPTDFGHLTEGFLQPEIFQNAKTSVPKDWKEAVYFEVFPNPVTDRVTLRTKEPIETPQLIQVLDLTGKVLFKTTLPSEAQQTEWSIRHLPEGLYLIQLLPGKGNLSNSIQISKIEK